MHRCTEGSEQFTLRNVAVEELPAVVSRQQECYDLQGAGQQRMKSAVSGVERTRGLWNEAQSDDLLASTSMSRARDDESLLRAGHETDAA